MRRLLLPGLLSLFFAGPAQAQSLPVLPQNPRGLRWQEVRTPHFRVIYTGGIDSAAQRTGDNAAPATGYCSQACAGAGAACPDPSFTCRPLLLDEATLAALCSTDSATCQAFPEGPKTFFCVKGGR